MSNTTPPTSASNLIVNDTQFEVVPRRRFERRGTNDRQVIKPEFATENEGMKAHKAEKAHANLLREGERRQFARRASRPTLLSATEISKLRKK
jgi:hypothetical protein